MAIDGGQILKPVVIKIAKNSGESKEKSSRLTNPGRRGSATKQAIPEVLIECGALSIKIGHDQVGLAVVVVIAAGYAHAGLKAAGKACGKGHFFELPVAEIVVVKIGSTIVCDVDVHEPVAVEVGSDQAKASAVAIDNS